MSSNALFSSSIIVLKNVHFALGYKQQITNAHFFGKKMCICKKTETKKIERGILKNLDRVKKSFI